MAHLSYSTIVCACANEGEREEKRERKGEAGKIISGLSVLLCLSVTVLISHYLL